MHRYTGSFTNYLGLGLVILGLAIATGKLPLPVARPLLPGLFLLGIGVALALADAPLDAFLSGEVETGSWSALFLDVLLVAAGVLVAAGSLIEWLWPGWLWSRATSAVGWGPILIGAGALLVMAGVLHLIDAAATRGTGWALLLSLPIVVLWGAVVLLGLALISLGVAQLASPGAVAAWIHNYFPPMPPPLPGD